MANLKKKITLSLNEETLEQLDTVAKERYRNVDRTKAIRWMIEDFYEKVVTDIDRKSREAS